MNLSRALRQSIRIIAIVTIVVGPFSIPEFGFGSATAIAQTGAPTGWCSDYSGRNFRCGSGGGGGGCAEAIQAQRLADAQARSTAVFLSNTGIEYNNAGDYAAAAGNFESALNQDPSYDFAREWLAYSLNLLGVEAYKRGDAVSSLLYFERAVEQKDEKVYRDNLAGTSEKVGNGGQKTCELCSKALISDIGYGLDASAEFTAYASQAHANWMNCKRRIAGDCAGSAGAELSSIISNCSRLYISGRWIAESYKACISTGHADVARRF